MSIRKVVAQLIGLCICLGVHSGEVDSPEHSYRIDSKSLQEERTYRVALPKNYHQSPHKNYPFLYILDGQKHFLHSVSTTTFLAGSGQIPEMIVVAIDRTIRIRDFTPTDWQAWEGGGGAKHFLSFLETELIPLIDSKYRTGKLRIVFGHSAGALFVLYSLYADPDLFDAYLAAGSLIEAIRAVQNSVVLATRFKDPNLKYFNEKLTKLDTKLGKREDEILTP